VPEAEQTQFGDNNCKRRCRLGATAVIDAAGKPGSSVIGHNLHFLSDVR
jgi:hypothetical protein